MAKKTNESQTLTALIEAHANLYIEGKYPYAKETFGNGFLISYKVYQGTAYHVETPDVVVSILDRALKSHHTIRLRIHYGDPKTGRAWDNKPETGSIGRSTGSIKIPLLIKTTRSLGGGGLLDNCIIKIEQKIGKTYKEVYKCVTLAKQS